MRRKALVGTVALSGALSTLLLLVAPSCGDDKTGVERLRPTAGRLEGDVDVEIVGRNFRQDIGYTVYFGVRRAKQVIIRDETSIIATTPEHRTEEPVDVRIVADDGHSWLIRRGFRYVSESVNIIEQLGEKQKKGPTKVIR